MLEKEILFHCLLGREYMDTEGLIPLLRNALNGISPTSPLALINGD